jgi:hypothetical protein
VGSHSRASSENAGDLSCFSNLTMVEIKEDRQHDRV